MKFGAHLSLSKGPQALLQEVDRLGMEAAQFFARNPRGRGEAKIAEADAQWLREQVAERDWNLTIHAPYYVGVGSMLERNAQIAREVTKLDLIKGDYLGVSGVVVHFGSPGKGFDPADATQHTVDTVTRILDETDTKCRLLLETSAGSARVGAKFEQLAEILKQVDNPERVGVCFDTCHAWTAGYDVRDSRITAVLDAFDATVGLQHLDVIHCNDTESDIDSGLDRHFHIGQGQIGQAAFDALVQDQRLADKTFILETPKGDKKAAAGVDDPDAMNLAALKHAL